MMKPDRQTALVVRTNDFIYRRRLAVVDEFKINERKNLNDHNKGKDCSERLQTLFGRRYSHLSIVKYKIPTRSIARAVSSRAPVRRLFHASNVSIKLARIDFGDSLASDRTVTRENRET